MSAFLIISNPIISKNNVEKICIIIVRLELKMIKDEEKLLANGVVGSQMKKKGI